MSKLSKEIKARAAQVRGMCQASGVEPVVQAGPESATLTGSVADGSHFTVSITPGDGRVAARLTVSPAHGTVEDYSGADFQGALDRMLRRHAGEPATDQDRFDMAGQVPEVACLRLVLVETAGEGLDLVSLTHGVVIASGDEFGVGPGIPCVVVGEEEEQEARRLAGVPQREGWPGWDVILPWLDKRFPAGN